ncbi:MAG: 3-deoxy-D-manno-octulosonic acid kinase [Aquimonas sp.]|nr:3-deoxy-D-manno-octulosonic acid kinase [Aquimonas sp.]
MAESHPPPAETLSPHGFAPIQEARMTDAEGAIVFDRLRVAQATRELLDPAHWVDRGRTEAGRGGRGAVCFVRAEFGEAVLRHYRRGGLAARLSRDLYLYTGEARTRAFQEFRLLAHLRGLGLPVPAPVAAGYRRRGLFYRGDLMTLAIPSTTPLATQLRMDAAGWAELGAVLARFHAEGVWHADLNAYNILRDECGRFWLIDFDRGRLRSPRPDWQQANLLRLQRSLRKLGLAGAELEQAWQALSQGYAQAGPGRSP